jgi:YVTN family beta-propeller protein
VGALKGTELIAVAYDTGDVYQVDWSTRQLVHTASAYLPQGFARGVSIVPDACMPTLFVTGARSISGCGVPPGATTDGPQQDFEWDSALVPSSTLLAVTSDFDGVSKRGVLELMDYSKSGYQSAPKSTTLLDSTTDTYPFDLVATPTTVYVVGQEAHIQATTMMPGPCTGCIALYAVDVATAAVTMKVPLGSKPRTPALSPDGTTMYVPDFTEGQIYVVDLASKSVSNMILTNGGPVGVAITPDGSRLLVADWNANQLQLLSATTGNPIQTINAGVNPSEVQLASDGKTVIVSTYGDKSLRFYSLGP